jgi:hypothetical protein
MDIPELKYEDYEKEFIVCDFISWHRLSAPGAFCPG